MHFLMNFLKIATHFAGLLRISDNPIAYYDGELIMAVKS